MIELGKTYRVTLKGGEHLMDIEMREDGTAMSKFATDDEFVPDPDTLAVLLFPDEFGVDITEVSE